jgi:hypothetical protein
MAAAKQAVGIAEEFEKVELAASMAVLGLVGLVVTRTTQGSEIAESAASRSG